MPQTLNLKATTPPEKKYRGWSVMANREFEEAPWKHLRIAIDNANCNYESHVRHNNKNLGITELGIQSIFGVSNVIGPPMTVPSRKTKGRSSTTRRPQVKRTAAVAPLAEEVRAFCSQHHVLAELTGMLELVKACFRLRGNPKLRVEIDPEDGDVYLDVIATVLGTVNEIYRANERFLDIATDKFDASVMAKIRMSYKIIEAK